MGEARYAGAVQDKVSKSLICTTCQKPRVYQGESCVALQNTSDQGTQLSHYLLLSPTLVTSYRWLRQIYPHQRYEAIVGVESRFIGRRRQKLLGAERIFNYRSANCGWICAMSPVSLHDRRLGNGRFRFHQKSWRLVGDVESKDWQITITMLLTLAVQNGNPS